MRFDKNDDMFSKEDNNFDDEGEGAGENEGEDENENDINEMMDEQEIFLTKKELMQTMHLDFQENKFKSKISYELLLSAIEIARESWFWKFKSANSKIAAISKIYKKISKIFAVVIKKET